MQLYDAACRGDLAGVEQALRNGANVDARRSLSCETSLHAASRAGHLAIVRVLLDAGANTEVRDSIGATALHDACDHGRLEVVREMVQRGADIFAKNRHGGTPFDYAACNGHTVVVEFLLQHYRETIYESEGRRSLLTILKQGEYPSYGRMVLQIGRWVSMDHMVGNVAILC